MAYRGRMPDGAYNVVAAILAVALVRYGARYFDRVDRAFWRAAGHPLRDDPATIKAPARSSSAPLWRWVRWGALAFVAYVVMWNVTR